MISESIRTLIGDADAAAARRDLPAAVKILTTLSVLQPDDATTWKKLAAITRALDRKSESLMAIDRALSIEPRDGLSLLLKGGLVEETGGDAEEAYRAALAFNDQTDVPSSSLRARLDHARGYCAAAHDRRTARLSDIARSQSDALGCSQTERDRVDAFVRCLADAVSPVLPTLSRDRYYDPSRFAGLVDVAGSHQGFMAEYLQLIGENANAATPYVDHPAGVPLDQWAELNHSGKWSAAHIWRGGVLVKENADRCPATRAAFDGLPTPHIVGKSPNLMYSVLSPYTHIPPHVGVTNVRLVVHVPLRIPQNCSLTVGGERRNWALGTAIIFDDTIEHEADNPTEETRVVLIGDLWHPDLTLNERKIVSLLMHDVGPS